VFARNLSKKKIVCHRTLLSKKYSPKKQQFVLERICQKDIRQNLSKKGIRQKFAKTKQFAKEVCCYKIFAESSPETFL